MAAPSVWIARVKIAVVAGEVAEEVVVVAEEVVVVAGEVVSDGSGAKVLGHTRWIIDAGEPASPSPAKSKRQKDRGQSSIGCWSGYPPGRILAW